MFLAIESVPHALGNVIATSPVRLMASPYWVVRTKEATLSRAHLAVINDGVETTVVTSDEDMAERLETSEMEGPFACFRLEVSLSFGAPGFIAAATSACATRGLNVFVISTFSFDYLLVPLFDQVAAFDALVHAGFPIAA